MKPYLIGGAVGAVGALLATFAAWAYVPAWQAELHYDDVPLSDREAKCDAALRAADAWATAGSYGRSVHWREEASVPCAMARLSRTFEGSR